MKMNLALFAAVLVFATACVRADVLTTKDGTKLEGDVKKTDGGYDVRSPDGRVTHVPSDRIASIAVGKGTEGPATPSVAADRLASLRRSVESLSDIPQIIQRYQRFIEQNKGSPIVAEAQQDLKQWQDRVDRGLVKIAGKWVTPEESAQLLAQVGQIVEQARAALQSNDLNAAQPLTAQALELDPQNVSALYLSGLLNYRQDKLQAAKKAFEQVNALMPNHAATLNNLGAINWRLNQNIAALNFYDQAMAALPENKEILNNVAEALNGVNTVRGGAELRKHPTVAKVTRRFTDQDARLQGVMAQYGWYRWGGTWVDQHSLDRLKEAEKEVRAKMDQMQRDYDALQAKIADTQQRIQADEDMMQRMVQDTYFRDANGQIFRTQLPEMYYQYQRDHDDLVSQKSQLQAQMESMKQSAKRVEQQLPTPKYTGAQQLIGVEGMPAKSSSGSSATTEPATQSSASSAK